MVTSWGWRGLPPLTWNQRWGGGGGPRWYQSSLKNEANETFIQIRADRVGQHPPKWDIQSGDHPVPRVWRIDIAANHWWDSYSAHVSGDPPVTHQSQSRIFLNHPNQEAKVTFSKLYPRVSLRPAEMTCKFSLFKLDLLHSGNIGAVDGNDFRGWSEYHYLALKMCQNIFQKGKALINIGGRRKRSQPRGSRYSSNRPI